MSVFIEISGNVCEQRYLNTVKGGGDWFRPIGTLIEIPDSGGGDAMRGELVLRIKPGARGP